MGYTEIAKTSAIAQGKMIPVDHDGRKLMVARVGDRYFVADRKCPHFGFNLCRGKLEGEAVMCPLHRARFDLNSGDVMRDPHILFLDMGIKRGLTVYPTRIEGDAVQAELVPAG